MKNQKAFGQFLEALKVEGLTLPKLDEIDNGLYCCSIEEKSKNLDLAARILVNLNLENPKKIKIPEITKNYFPMKAKIIVETSPLYSEDFECDEINPKEWHKLPKQFKEKIELIRPVDNYLDSYPFQEWSIVSARNLPHKLFYDEYDKTLNTWRGFYSSLVSEGALRWAEIKGEKFPYVATTSDRLRNVGRSAGGLYFVSTDVAKEPWQEQIIAYHERFCQLKSHKFAKQKEKELAKILGKEEELKKWRLSIADIVKKGGYFTG